MCGFRKLRAWCDAQRFDDAGKNAVRLEKVIFLFFVWSIVSVFFNVFLLGNFWYVINFAVWGLVLLIGWHGALKRNTASLAAFNMLMMFKILMFLFSVVFLLAFASAMVVVPLEMGMEMQMHQDAANEEKAMNAFHSLNPIDALPTEPTTNPDEPVTGNVGSEEGGKIMDTASLFHDLEQPAQPAIELEDPPVYMDVAIIRHVMLHFMMFGATSIFGIFIYVLVYLYPLVLMLLGIFFAGRTRSHLLVQRYTAELLSRQQASRASPVTELHQAPAPSPVNNMFPQQTPYPASPVVMYYAPVPSAPGKQ
jgi:hypothetical protein